MTNFIKNYQWPLLGALSAMAFILEFLNPTMAVWWDGFGIGLLLVLGVRAILTTLEPKKGETPTKSDNPVDKDLHLEPNAKSQNEPSASATAQLLFSWEDMIKILPVVISDLKHATEPELRVRNNANIRHELYMHVIRELFNENRFKHVEKVDQTANSSTGREGLFIKGYVRDVWAYLETAYGMIHNIDFEKDFADLIRTVK